MLYFKSSNGRSRKIAVIGTSYMWGPLRILMGQRLLAHARFYYYFSSVFDFENGDINAKRLEIGAADGFWKALPEIDAVVVEANEAALGQGHLPAFLAAIR